MAEEENKGTGKIVPRVIEDEMKSSYLGYSMSVIAGRALPDIRDGLKPVHRRILYAMHKMGMVHNKPFKKSARIVGEVLGKYHPHGDMAVYDSMVRMVQNFSMRYPLIDGQGNFGSVDGDNAAAMRYTEARMKKLAEDLLQDIDKDTVNFTPNFDGSLKEPVLLPAKAPNLLINGSSGIAVGMATNIPPHNISEVCEGAIRAIENPSITADELMQYVKAPDFPTGGIICGTDGIKQAYRTGKGKIRVRAKAEIEDHKGKQRIIVTEIPYQINKAQMITGIAGLIKEKKIQGIVDIRDESDKSGIRVVIELKQGANSDVVLNQLYKHTTMQTTFGVIMLGLIDNQPRVFNLKGIITHFIGYRKDVVTKRTQFDLAKAEEKAHILEGILTALESIDPVIKLVKESKSVEQARQGLQQSFRLSEKQAQAILDMKLQRLTSLEQQKVRDEHAELTKLISELKKLLSSDKGILDVIRRELEELKEKYGDSRRTHISLDGDSDLEEEDMIKPEDVVVTVSHAGYIKRVPISEYREQKRGGRGVIAAGTREEDFIEEIFVTNTLSSILFFTNLGKVHWLKVYKVPETARQAKGTAIINLLQLGKGESISTLVPVKEFKSDRFITMVTAGGVIKRTSLDNFSSPRKGGIAAINLNDGDELISAMLTTGSSSVIIATSNGIAARFMENDIRPMGRGASGVRGIRLKENDSVIGMVIARENRSLLTVTKRGFGKKTPVDDYRVIRRGGSGVINLRITEKNGKVASIKSVVPEDGIMIMTRKGITIRLASENISEIGRNTQGVRLIRLDPSDEVVAAAKVKRECNGDSTGSDKPGN